MEVFSCFDDLFAGQCVVSDLSVFNVDIHVKKNGQDTVLHAGDLKELLASTGVHSDNEILIHNFLGIMDYLGRGAQAIELMDKYLYPCDGVEDFAEQVLKRSAGHSTQYYRIMGDAGVNFNDPAVKGLIQTYLDGPAHFGFKKNAKRPFPLFDPSQPNQNKQAKKRQQKNRSATQQTPQQQAQPSVKYSQSIVPQKQRTMTPEKIRREELIKEYSKKHPYKRGEKLGEYVMACQDYITQRMTQERQAQQQQQQQQVQKPTPSQQQSQQNKPQQGRLF